MLDDIFLVGFFVPLAVIVWLLAAALSVFVWGMFKDVRGM